MAGAVVGIGDARNSLNLAVHHTFEENGDDGLAMLVGGDIQMSPRTKLFAEYLNADALMIDDDDDLHGFINIGLRIFGQDHSFSLSGFRPLLVDTDSFLAFPILMYSHRL